jgi:hypothetical protein
VNVVDRHKLAHLLTSFTVHNYEKEQEDILANFKELKAEKKRPPHDLYEYTAAPSVQRRGGYHNHHYSYRTDGRQLRRSQLTFRRSSLTRRGG